MWGETRSLALMGFFYGCCSLQSTIQTSLTQKHLRPLPILPLAPLPSPPPPHPSPLQGELRAGASRLLSKMPETSPLVPFLLLNCSLTSTFLFLTPSLFYLSFYSTHINHINTHYHINILYLLVHRGCLMLKLNAVIWIKSSCCVRIPVLLIIIFLFHNNLPRISNITDKHGIFRRNQTSAKFVKTEEPPSEDFRVQISL